MNKEFLEILVCPVCKGKLEYRADVRRLICRADRLAYPITDDNVPVLIAEEAATLENEQ